LPSAPKASSTHISWIVAAIMTVVAAAGWLYGLRAPRPRQAPLMNLSVDLGPDAIWGEGIAVAISPDGTRIAFRTRRADGKAELSVSSLDSLASPPSVTALPGTTGAENFFFSPDGQWLAFRADNKLKRIAVARGAAATICDAFGYGGGSWGE